MKGPTLQGGQAFAYQLRAAIDQASFFSAVFNGAARYVVIIRLVGLPQIRRIAIGHGSFFAHPVNGGAGVEPTGESDAHVFTERQRLKNIAHVY